MTNYWTFIKIENIYACEKTHRSDPDFAIEGTIKISFVSENPIAHPRAAFEEKTNIKIDCAPLESYNPQYIQEYCLPYANMLYRYAALIALLNQHQITSIQIGFFYHQQEESVMPSEAGGLKFQTTPHTPMRDIIYLFKNVFN